MNTINHYINGQYQATYTLDDGTIKTKTSKNKTYKQIAQRRKYAQRDARLVQILATR